MKKIFATLSLFVFLSFVLATPAHAAENPFQKAFNSISNSVSNSFQRLVLILPGDKDGKIVMNQVAQASQNIKSANADTTITIDLQKQDNSLANVKVNVAGPFEIKDAFDPSSYKQSIHASTVLSMQGTTLNADADLRVTKDFLYFKLNQMPALPMFDFSSVTGKWLKTENTSSSTTEASALTPEQQQRMKDAAVKLLRDAQYSSAKKETKNGRPVYVLEATFPKLAVEQYIETAMAIQKENIKDDKTQTEMDAEKTEGALAKAINNVEDIKATLWVDRNSFFVTHLDMPLVYTPEKKAMSAEGTEKMSPTATAANPLAALDEVDKVKIAITVDLKDFNQPISFDEPKDAQDAKEVFQGIMGKPAVTPNMGVGSSELPGLTPTQRMQIQKYENMKKEINAMDNKGAGEIPTTLPSGL